MSFEQAAALGTAAVPMPLNPLHCFWPYAPPRLYCPASLFVSIRGGVSPRIQDLLHSPTVPVRWPIRPRRERIPPPIRRHALPSWPLRHRTRPRPPDSPLPCRSPPALPSWTGQAVYNIVLGPPPDAEGVAARHWTRKGRVRVPRGSNDTARGVPGAPPPRAAVRRAPAPPSRSRPRPTRRVHGRDGPAWQRCRGRLRPSAAAASGRRRPAARPPPELRLLLLLPGPFRLNLPVHFECVGVPMPCSYELCAI